MSKRTPPEYTTPQGFRCPSCGDECEIIPLLNDFDYGPSHASHGLPGCHFPNSWGSPSCDCCGAIINEPIDYEDDYYE